MNPKLILLGLGLGAGVALVAAVVIARNKEKFNPASDQNFAYQLSGDVVQAITGGAAAGGEDTVGGVFARLREWISGDDAAIRAMQKGSTTQHL